MKHNDNKDSQKKSQKTSLPSTATRENEGIRMSGKGNAKPYFAGIDIIKIMALLFVVALHSFLYNGFYSASIDNESYLLPIAVRWVVYTCVPLFMISTGYLMRNKKFSGKYYLGIIKILVVYIAVSIPCMMADKKYLNAEFTKWKVIKGFFHFSNAPYSWYINLYITLFFAIPFLNAAFDALKNQKERLALVITAAVFTCFANSLFIGTVRGDQIRLVPNYINAVYPFAYYYVGAYLREYPPKKKLITKSAAFVILCTALFALTKLTYKQSFDNMEDDRKFLSWNFNNYGSYPVFIIAVCIFVLLFDIQTRNNAVKFVLRQLSGATLGGFLISYVFDRRYYQFKEGSFLLKYPIDTAAGETWNIERFYHSYEAVGHVFIRALFWGVVINVAYELIAFLFRLGISKLTASEEAKVNADVPEKV